MSHTKIAVGPGWFRVVRKDGNAWFGGTYHEVNQLWYVANHSIDQVAEAFESRKEAIQYAVVCIARDMLLDGTLPAVSPEDRVYSPNAGVIRYHMEK